MNEETKAYPQCDFAQVKDIINMNYKPHPFTVGARHVEYAAKHTGGILDERVTNAVPCAASVRGQACALAYNEHTSDRVALIQLKRDCEASEMQTWLMSLLEWAASEKADGFVFVETPQQFRIS